MEKVKPINYESLWCDLVNLGEERRARKRKKPLKDHWMGKASEFDERVNTRWQKTDSSREFVLSTLHQFSKSTVMDIGAGSGSWVSWMAPYAKSITAIDPSESMLAQLNLRIESEKLDNVKVIKGCWPDVEVNPHDISFCSHSVYGAGDLPAFIHAMQEKTSKRIIMLLRAPGEDGLMAQATRLVWGHPYDSPNYQIAIRILWSMGIFPNVIMEDDNLWKPWSHQTLDDAFEEMKNRLGLYNTDEWDTQLTRLLQENLVYTEGKYVWPVAMRTALLYWDM